MLLGSFGSSIYAFLYVNEQLLTSDENSSADILYDRTDFYLSTVVQLFVGPWPIFSFFIFLHIR
jgi:hypothetical protein